MSDHKASPSTTTPTSACPSRIGVSEREAMDHLRTATDHSPPVVSDLVSETLGQVRALARTSFGLRSSWEHPFDAPIAVDVRAGLFARRPNRRAAADGRAATAEITTTRRHSAGRSERETP